MHFDLDKVIAAVAPAPVTITIDGRDHKLRELLLGEVLMLDQLGKLGGERQVVAFIRSLFVAPAPAVLGQYEAAADKLDELRREAAEDLANEGESIDVASIRSVQLMGTAIHREFLEAEDAYGRLGVQVSMIIAAIGEAVAETTPGNARTAAIAMIRRQAEEASNPSAESA